MRDLLNQTHCTNLTSTQQRCEIRDDRVLYRVQWLQRGIRRLRDFEGSEQNKSITFCRFYFDKLTNSDRYMKVYHNIIIIIIKFRQFKIYFKSKFASFFHVLKSFCHLQSPCKFVLKIKLELSLLLLYNSVLCWATIYSLVVTYSK